MKTYLLLAAALAVPQAANAAAVASASLFSTDVSINLVAPADAGGSVFSLNTANLNGGSGDSQSASLPIPGAADAAQAAEGGITADSFVNVPGTTGAAFSTDANGNLVLDSNFGSSTGRVTAAFDFSNTIANAVITIIIDLTRQFSLSTENPGDLASGRTSIEFGILDSLGSPLLSPTLTLSDPVCNPNATFTAVNGNDFTNSCTSTATWTFSPLALGDFTLTFGASSNIDVVTGQGGGGQVPAPATVAVLGLGLAALGFTRSRRR